MSDITVIQSNPRNEHAVDVEFKAFIKGKSSSEIYLQVLTQEAKLDKVAWEKAMGKFDFPFSIEHVDIVSVNGEELNGTTTHDITLSLETDCLRVVSNVNESIELEGVLKLSVQSNDYIPNVAIRTVG